MKKTAAVFLCIIALLLGGCELDPIAELPTDPAEETTASTTSTSFDIGKFTAPQSSATHPAPAESTSESTTTEITRVTTTVPVPDPEITTAATTTTTAEFQVRTANRLSMLSSVSLQYRTDPAEYETERDGQTVFDPAAAAKASGFREKDGVFTLEKDGQTVTVRLGTAIPETDPPVLQTIIYTCGGVTVTIDQRAPKRAKLYLADGTAITPDQALLVTYLTEQLADDPAEDPLLFVIPSAYQETIGAQRCYYLP